MLPTESLQDAFLFLSRDDLDAIQLVSSMLNSVVANLPGDSPVRHIACLYPTTGPDGSLQVDLDRDERDADLTVLTVECKDTSLFVRNASVANVSFGALYGSVDWTTLVDHLRCLKPLLSSACVHLVLLDLQLPPPGPLLRALFEDVLDTRVGLNISSGQIKRRSRRAAQSARSAIVPTL